LPAHWGSVMARATEYNLHTRVVNILKLVLPLIALVLLATLFLFSHKINPEDAIPYATVDVADRLQDPKMTDAGYSAMTKDGSSLVVSAAEARPGSDGSSMKQVVGTLTTPNGSKTDLVAATAQMNSDSSYLALGGGMQIDTSGGYRILTEGAEVSTEQMQVESTGAITGTGPIGDLSADKMVLSQSVKDGPYLMVFKGNVRLLYKPEERQDR
jgi:lipopolysaccharide export system protein LptC